MQIYNTLHLLCAFIALQFTASAQNTINEQTPTKAENVLILEGSYEGANIYIQNPASDSGFCTEKVLVNEKEAPFENSSAYEINLANQAFRIGDPVKILIFHKDNCRPRALHFDAHRKRALNIVSMDVSAGGFLKWYTTNEEAYSLYVIEQFRWNTWIKVAEISNKNIQKDTSYEYQLIPHSGENKVRVKKMIAPTRYEYSKTLTFMADKKMITYSLDKITKQILFSDETLYKLYDSKGNFLKTGSGKTIDCSGIKKGMYFLNYDNTTAEINFYK